MPESQMISIGTYLASPIVIQKANELSGFSIELWREIASKLALEYHFKQYSNLDQLLQATAKDQVDLAIGAIAITSAQAKILNFSYPIYNSGLGIMVPSFSGDMDQTPLSYLHNLLTIVVPKLLGFTLIFLAVGVIFSLIIAHLVWLFEHNRQDDQDLLIPKEYFPGIFEAFWWSLTTLFGQQMDYPKNALSRLVSFVWVFIATVMLIYLSSSLTSEMTLQHIRGNIRGLSDLQGRTIATTKNTVPTNLLEQYNIKAIELNSQEQVYDNLLSGKVDAIMLDSLVLMNYAIHQGLGKVTLVGEPINPKGYGIAYSAKSNLKKSIDLAILELQEDGTYQKLYDLYFKKS